MKIRKYAARQFAGISSHKVQFTDGMNVVLGDNETGKSTMIAAIYSALMKSVKLDRRKDTEFMKRYFPAGDAGNADSVGTIDVSLDIESDGKCYALSKIWDINAGSSSAELQLEGGGAGTLWRGMEAEKKLAGILKYGNDAYRALVFGMQSNEEEILDWFYRFFADRADGTVSQVRKSIEESEDVLSAAGGFSGDRFVRLLDDRMAELSGRWDFDIDLPEKKHDIDNMWISGKGKIVNSYYAMRTAEREYTRVNEAQERILENTQMLAGLKQKLTELEDAEEQLSRQQGEVQNAGIRRKRVAELGEKLEKLDECSREWPYLEKEKEAAAALLAEKNESMNRTLALELKKRADEASELEQKKKVLEAKLNGMEHIREDRDRADRFSALLSGCRVSMSGTALKASVKMTAPYAAEVTSAGDEKKEVTSEDSIQAKGFVKINVPGVAEIEVAPAEIDLEDIRRKISEYTAGIGEIYNKYGVKSADGLAGLCDTVQGYADELQRCESRSAAVCQGSTVEELNIKRSGITVNEGMAVRENLSDVISDFLKKSTSHSDTPPEVIAADRSTTERFEREYSSAAELESLIRKLRAELEEAEDELEVLTEHGARRFMSEQEFNAEMKKISDLIDETQDKKEKTSKVIWELSQEEEKDPAELMDRYLSLKAEFERLKKTHGMYERLKKDFAELKSGEGDRYEAFNKSFNEKLGAITDEATSISDFDELRIKSAGGEINDRMLMSEGTKKTVLLAFRLSVLEHIYGKDGGVIVLDDILLDMDPGRRERAAALLNSFAAGNQVIFTTCDPKIAELLGGNVITDLAAGHSTFIE